jgi:hypothetical protein
MQQCAYPAAGSSPTSAEEEVYYEALPTVHGEELKPDAAALERLLWQWRREQGRRTRGRWQIALLALIGGIGIFVGAAMNWSLFTMIALAFVGMMVLIPFGVEAVRLSSNSESGLFARLKSTLQEIDDVRAVVPLLEMLDWNLFSDPRTTELPMTPTLTRLLSQMTDDEAAQILTPHLDRLYSCLEWIAPLDYPDLLIAVLRLLPAINDRQALIFAAQYVVHDASTRNQRKVREAAGDALTSLLATVDLGGPAALSGWIDGLPFDDTTLDWDDLLAPLAILQALPQTTLADYAALDYRSRRRLYASVISMDLHRLKTDYTLAVLNLARLAADVEALDMVRQLQMASELRIREAARLCLPTLEQKREQEKSNRTLLRGSSAPRESAGTLLRSAAGGTSDDSNLLLRVRIDKEIN